MYSWNSIDDMFAALERAGVVYIILRNHEEIDQENFYTSGHADIDFLVIDPRRFAKQIHAAPRFQTDDRIHYIVNIGGTKVVLDLRSLGDDYYDTKWQRSMIKNRAKKDGRFYIMDEVNYYYSLIYHAVLQKKALADDYLQRLNAMAARLSVNAESEEGHLAALENFMRQRGYFYTIPYDIWVPLRTKLVRSDMVKKNFNVYLRDYKTAILSFGSKVKRFILRR